ncbi:MAG: methyltransferase [Bacteroidota bacterium]|nr:methyltransferase [Bacteroidota bacterium]
MSLFRKKILETFVKPVLTVYLKKDRYHTYKGIKVLIKTGVFHPAFFYSTKFILRSVEQIDFKNKTVLELGAGSGLISLHLVKRNAIVTAIDINPSSIDSIKESAKLNSLKVNTYVSDLFSQVPSQTFDFIIINPPYYRGEATSIEQQAWYAGKDLEYFEKLFSELGNYMIRESMVFMSLSEDCELDKIKEIAHKHDFLFLLFKQEKIKGEKNYLLEIKNRS